LGQVLYEEGKMASRSRRDVNQHRLGLPSPWPFVRRALSRTSLSTVHEADAHLVSSRVLCTTFDLSKQQPAAALEQGLGAWLPRGYQVYAVALQRCRVLPRLRQAIHAHLGKPCDICKEHIAS
jgi:hypothetical protein